MRLHAYMAALAIGCAGAARDDGTKSPAAAPTAAPTAAPAAAPAALISATITPELLRADVAQLSSDEMGGRFFRSPFALKAAVCVEERLSESGLVPLEGRDSMRMPIDDEPETGPNIVARFAIADAKRTASDATTTPTTPSALPPANDGIIIISAHYDHLRPRRSGDDRIFNGADDNASGVCGMLAVARALRALADAGQPPQCTVVFIAFNGEEAGLRGSNAFVAKPPLSLAKVRGVFNMDMISRGRPREIFIDGGAVGAPLIERLRKANEQIKLSLRIDEHPDWLPRSDQAAFLAKRIPAVLFSVEDHEDYHRVTDHVEKIDAALAADVARLVALTVWDMSCETLAAKQSAQEPSATTTSEPPRP